MKRRILSIITALALCLSLCPSWAFAAEGTDPPVRITRQPEDDSGPYFLPLGLFIETEPAVGADGVSCQWYEVKDGVEEKVSNGNGGTSNMFVPDDWLDVGTYQYFCEVTKDGYTVRSRTLTYTVYPYPIDAIVEGNVEKVYDGTTEVPADHRLTVAKISSAIYNKIQITLQAESFRYETASAGKNKAVIADGVTFSCSDPDKEKNFRLGTILAGKVGIITKAPLTITGADVAPKTYEEGNVVAKIRSLTFSGLVPGETLAIGEDYTANGFFLDADAGEDKAFAVMAFLTDSVKAGNYRFPDPSYSTTGTISKAPWDIQVTGVPDEITYGDTFTLQSGDALSWRAEGCAEVDGQGSVTVTGAGEITITATKAGDQNHVDTDYPIYLNSHRKALTVSGAIGGKVYDGTNEVEITGVTLEGIVGDDDVSANTTGLTGTVSGSNTGTYTAVTLPRLTLTGGTASNYELSQSAGTVPANVTIRKAAPLPTKAGDLAAANKQAHTYTYGLGALRPDLPEGMSFGSGAVTYELGDVTLASGYYTGGAEIQGQTLTLPIQAVESSSEGRIGTVTVIIHSDNFEDMTATINVRSVNKIIPTGGPTLSGTTLTYGQALSAITLSGSMQDNGTPVPGTFAWSSPANRPAVQESYAAAWTFTPADNNKYAIVTGTASIRVLPAPIAGAVIVLEPSAFRYDGTGHRPGIAGVTLDGTPLTADVDYTASIPEGTEAGAYTVTLTGKGSYTGEATAVFTINPVEQKPLDQTDDDGNELRLEVETGLSTVPAALKANEQFDTPEKIETALRTRVAEVMNNVGEQIAVFDVTLQYKDESGAWHSVDPNNFPAEGVTAVLPYPAGTGAAGYTFTVQHLISSGAQAGTMETLDYELTADGLRCRFSSLSPVAIGYQAAKPDPQPVPGGGTHWDGGSSSVPNPKPKPEEKPEAETPCDGGADCPSRGFTDLGGVGTWYHEAVDYVLRNGLMNGYSNGTFGPNNSLTRAQFAQILFNKEGRPVVNYLLQYGDVAEGAWYTEAIRWAASRGIVGGYGGGMFGPDDSITREQLAVMLWRYAGSPAAAGKELHFTDADKASGYALEALCWAVEKGVMSGKGGGILDPQGLATRAQVSEMLMNFLEK